MPKFVKKAAVVEANQWFKNGDHPDDGTPFYEGKVVRYFNDPTVHGETVCQLCNKLMNKHGWIDTVAGGVKVCPGDYVLTCANGKYWPYNPETFFHLYYTHSEYAKILTSKYRAQRPIT